MMSSHREENVRLSSSPYDLPLFFHTGCVISRNPRDRSPIVDCESLTDPMFCQSQNYYYRISPDDSTGATSASSSGESLSVSPSGKMDSTENHRPMGRCQQVFC